jgi:prevent-host-death family protein
MNCAEKDDAMTLHVSISEAKARLSRFVERAAEENQQIIIESHGNPKAVLIPYSDYEQFAAWQETQRRQQALAQLQQLTRQIRARNQDLSLEAGEALADRYARDVIEEMIAEDKVNYDRGEP